jgi:hypothetical protein
MRRYPIDPDAKNNDNREHDDLEPRFLEHAFGFFGFADPHVQTPPPGYHREQRITFARATPST